MAAPKGHKMYGNPIKPKSYTPDEFWLGACNYFEWCKDNPLIKKDFIKSGQNAGELVDIPMERPYSISGLCIYLDIDSQTFYNYLKREGYEMYFETCKRIKEIIDTQHFEGGMVGNFNANIVTRKLGLVEKQDIQSENTFIWREEKTYSNDEIINKADQSN